MNFLREAKASCRGGASASAATTRNDGSSGVGTMRRGTLLGGGGGAPIQSTGTGIVKQQPSIVRGRGTRSMLQLGSGGGLSAPQSLRRTAASASAAARRLTSSSASITFAAVGSRRGAYRERTAFCTSSSWRCRDVSPAIASCASTATVPRGFMATAPIIHARSSFDAAVPGVIADFAGAREVVS